MGRAGTCKREPVLGVGDEKVKGGREGGREKGGRNANGVVKVFRFLEPSSALHVILSFFLAMISRDLHVILFQQKRNDQTLSLQPNIRSGSCNRTLNTSIHNMTTRLLHS